MNTPMRPLPMRTMMDNGLAIDYYADDCKHVCQEAPLEDRPCRSIGPIPHSTLEFERK